MHSVVDENRYDKLEKIQNILSRIGTELVNIYDRKIYLYKGLVWHFYYRYEIRHCKSLKWCIFTAEQWELPENSRWTLEELVKQVCETRLKVDEEVRLSYELYPGSRYNNDKNLIEYMATHNEDDDTLESMAKKALMRAADFDYYYMFEHDKD